MASDDKLFDRRGADWEALAQQYGTPYFLLDADHVQERIALVRDAFQGQACIYFAVKTNPNLGLLRALVGHADGVDISSAGELDQALLAGFDPERMSFAGPAKSDAELQAAIAAGVGCISAESLREIAACARIAQGLGRRARILLRVNPALPNKAYGLKMGGRAVQFGIDEEVLPQAEALLRQVHKHVECRGIHAYIGSQCFDAAGLVEATRNALRIAAEVARRTGQTPTRINLGGGFGMGHGDDAKELDVQALGQMLAPDLAAYRTATQGHCDLIFELGRFLAAEAGIYVARVIDTKISRGKSFVTCDGGLHHQLAAAGTFGAALRGNFALRNLSRPEAAEALCSIAGPSCNPTDLLGVDCRLPELAQGDLLGVLMSGSYGLTASPLLFLGRDTPVELVRNEGRVKVGRRRFRITDFN